MRKGKVKRKNYSHKGQQNSKKKKDQKIYEGSNEERER